MKTLKLQNVPAIFVFVTWCTALLLVCAGAPNDFWASLNRRFAGLGAKDGLLLALTPLISVIANGLFSPTVKAALVFWRVRDILPGHRAFSVHANADPRVNLQSLRNQVSPWPIDPVEQNRAWYSLYRSVDDAVRVKDAHRAFLLSRDLTSIALTFVVAGIPATILLGSTLKWTLVYAGFAIVQYIVLAIVARNHGTRFVRNVLAEVSTSGKSTR